MILDGAIFGVAPVAAPAPAPAPALALVPAFGSLMVLGSFNASSSNVISPLSVFTVPSLVLSRTLAHDMSYRD